MLPFPALAEVNSSGDAPSGAVEGVEDEFVSLTWFMKKLPVAVI